MNEVSAVREFGEWDEGARAEHPAEQAAAGSTLRAGKDVEQHVANEDCKARAVGGEVHYQLPRWPPRFARRIRRAKHVKAKASEGAHEQRRGSSRPRGHRSQP